LPLSERARIEIYLPDLPTEQYQNLLSVFQRELTYTFGGCTVLRGIEGSYLSIDGVHIADHVSIVYSDAPFEFEGNLAVLSKYADELRDAAFEALDEEAVMVVAMKVYQPSLLWISEAHCQGDAGVKARPLGPIVGYRTSGPSTRN